MLTSAQCVNGFAGPSPEWVQTGAYDICPDSDTPGVRRRVKEVIYRSNDQSDPDDDLVDVFATSLSLIILVTCVHDIPENGDEVQIYGWGLDGADFPCTPNGADLNIVTNEQCTI